MRSEQDAPAARRRWALPAVLAIGVAIRLALLPITFGQDFTVWDKAAASTLQGIDIYAHHPDYIGGPYAYFPLFLYLELPFRWAAEHGLASFLVLGKLPILAADVACCLLLARELRRRGVPERWVALGSAAFFLDPLVIYDSAWYGRFDTLGCALLLVVTSRLRRPERGAWPTGVWFGLAVAAKTFPVLIVLTVARAVGRRRGYVLLVAVAVVALVSAPYLGSWQAMVHDIVLYDGQVRAPNGLSWQYELTRIVALSTAKRIGYLVLVGYAVALALLCRRLGTTRYVAATLVLFLLTAKFVLEQYLIWPMPWLVLLAVTDGNRRVRRASGALLAVLTIVGMLDNESFHPWGRSAAIFIAILDTACVFHLAVLMRAGRDAPTEAGDVPSASEGRELPVAATAASAARTA